MRSVRASVHAVSSGHPIRAPARLQRFLRAGTGISEAVELSAVQSRGVADVERPQRGQGEIFRRTFETRTGKTFQVGEHGRLENFRPRARAAAAG